MTTPTHLFREGQRVHVEGYGAATVIGPDKFQRHRIEVRLDVQSPEGNRFVEVEPAQLTPLQEINTMTKVASKTSKNNAATAPFDFKAAATETRAKMWAKAEESRGKKAGRKKAERTVYSAGSCVSYRFQSRYIHAYVHEVLPDGSYRLELPADAPAEGQFTVIAPPEQVTPRAGDLSEIAPLEVGDVVQRQLFPKEGQPLPIAGTCVVKSVDEGGQVVIENEAGQTWEGQPDPAFLRLSGRARMWVALRDLGRVGISTETEMEPMAFEGPQSEEAQLTDRLGIDPRQLFAVGTRVRLTTMLHWDEEPAEYDGIVDHHGIDEGLKYDAWVNIPFDGLTFAGDYRFDQLTWVAAPGSDLARALRDLIPDKLIGEMTDEEKRAEERAEIAADYPSPEDELNEPEVAVTPEAAELPGTPRPVTAPALIPGTLGLLQVPLSQLVKSPCNVRRHYDQQAIEELAGSLEKQGQLENLTGRWNAEGQVEAVAGETRRRAFLHLLERGSIQSDHPVLVYVRDLSDVQAIEASATENMRRSNMTPLEECEAMLRLKQAGQSEDDIALTFGYKSTQPVHDRILVATNLFPKGRDLLEEGQISFAQAAVIARANGESLQKTMLDTAKSGSYNSSAKALAEQLTRGQFLVEDARFDIELSGLEVKQDMFGTFEPFFVDKAKGLNAQIAWAEAECERLGVTGKRAFYQVETGESAYFYASRTKHFQHADAKDDNAGTVYYVCTATGELSIHKDVQLKKEAVVPTTSTQDAKPAQREFSDPFYTAAHQLRAQAARGAIIGQPHYTLALAVMGLILGSGHQTDHRGRVNVAEVNGTPDSRDKAELPAALASALQALQKDIQGTVSGQKPAAIARLERTGNHPDPELLLRLLVGKTTEELLGYLNTLTALTAYDWSGYFPKNKAGKEYDYLASLTGANAVLARTFKLTDEWLKRYPRHELAALADEAGLGRQMVEDAKTLKDARGKILEHADRLAEQGFVPSHLRFAEVVK